MKTLEQIFEEIRGSEELKKKLETVIKEKGDITGFMKENGCDVTEEELSAYLEEKKNEKMESGELTPDELEAVSGGSGLLGGTIILSFVLLDLVAVGVHIATDD